MAMEVAVELELDDDVFFADISKQLNLLITDEDEQNPISLSSSVSFQVCPNLTLLFFSLLHLSWLVINRDVDNETGFVQRKLPNISNTIYDVQWADQLQRKREQGNRSVHPKIFSAKEET